MLTDTSQREIAMPQKERLRVWKGELKKTSGGLTKKGMVGGFTKKGKMGGLTKNQYFSQDYQNLIPLTILDKLLILLPYQFQFFF